MPLSFADVPLWLNGQEQLLLHQVFALSLSTSLMLIAKTMRH
jgi:hypothetical protein